MGTRVRFWMDAYKNEAKSKEAGMAVFDTVPWCEIQVLGEPDNIRGPVHKIQPDPRLEYPAAWAQWQRDNSTEGIVGTLLSEVPWITRGEVETLRAAGFRTLEEVASVADGSLSGLPGGLATRQKARDRIAAAKSDAPAQRMSEELAKRDEEIRSLKAQISEILTEKRKQRGREA